MDNKLKKNYIYICYTFLALAIYVIFFPIIAKFLSYISPNLTECVYKKITGKPCPLCGGTRYIANIKQVLKTPSYLLHPFGLIIIFIIFEVFFRIFCIYSVKKEKINLKKLLIVDSIIHIIAIISFFVYEICFLIS